MPNAGNIHPRLAQSRVPDPVKSPEYPIAVLITRPQPQADRLARELSAAMGPMIRPIIAPLMQTRALSANLPVGPHDAVILSSEAGAIAAKKLRRTALTLPERAYCVGDRTAKIARSLGFDVRIDGPTAEALIAKMLHHGVVGRLLYLHGQDVSTPIDRLLTSAGIPTDAAATYAQEPIELTTEAMIQLATDAPLVVPIYSARSARLFLSVLPKDFRADLRPCLISPDIMPALSETFSARAVVAERPDGPSMVAAIRRVISSLLP